MDRSGDHENRRYDDLLPGNDPGNRDRRYARTKPSKRSYRHHCGKLDKICTSGKKYGFEGETKSVCGSRRCKRYWHIQNSLEAHTPEYADDHDGNGSSRYGNHDAGTGISLFPGLWCSCTDTGMGTDAE